MLILATFDPAQTDDAPCIYAAPTMELLISQVWEDLTQYDVDGPEPTTQRELEDLLDGEELRYTFYEA